jgi:hypothetical protein
MRQSEFTEKFHWMNGLSEYFRYTGQEDKYEPIFKALYHNNYYRKRDIIMQLITRDGINLSTTPPELIKSWINMLLNEHFDEIEVKPELITSLLSLYSNDMFVERICRFINYFLFDHSTDLLLPDLGDFLSRGQVKSKLWMAEELANVVDGPIGNVVFYGGWYNFMAHFLFSKFDVSHVYSLDLDNNVYEPCKILYREEVVKEQFTSITCDVNKVVWNAPGRLTLHNQGLYDLLKDQLGTGSHNHHNIRNMSRVDLKNINLIINTSCEHMNNSWFENLPSGTMVVLQTNDYFSNPQHSNCCENLEAAKLKYPMQEFLYTGELSTHLYNRFMLIGIK